MQRPKRCRGSASRTDGLPHPSPPPTRTRFDCPSVPMPPLEGGAAGDARLPALMIRPRPAGTLPGPPKHVIQALGQLDTGATSSAVPIWLLRRLGIPLDKKTRRQIYTVSGKLWAYSVRLGMEIQCGGSWFDIGEADVIVPDTPWSRDPNARRPILLGLNGFFDRVRMCIDHLNETFWIRLLAAGGAAGGVGGQGSVPHPGPFAP